MTKIRNADAPPGGVPYHPNEMMADVESSVMQHTGLIGIAVMFCITCWTAIQFMVSIPFVLLGLAEIVALTPNSWRIRWIRRD